MNLSEFFDKVKEAFGPQDGSEPPDAAVVETRDPAADAEAKRIIADFIAETERKWDFKAQEIPSGKRALESSPDVQIALILRMSLRDGTNAGWKLRSLFTPLFMRNQPFADADLEALLERSAKNPYGYFTMVPSLLRHVKRRAGEANVLTPAMRKHLARIRKEYDDRAGDAESRKIVATIDGMLGIPPAVARPDAGETWSDLALADLAAMENDRSLAWGRLFQHAQTADGSKPSKVWGQAAKPLVEAIGDSFMPALERWFGAVTSPRIVVRQHTYSGRTYDIPEAQVSDRNISLLKGLAWCCGGRQEPEMARALARLAEGALKKLPGTGPWAVRAASAAVWALGEMEGEESVAALCRLRLKVTHRGTLQQIEKAVEAAAKKRGMTREDLEDMAVPTYGFEQSGDRLESFGEFEARLTIDCTGDIELAWFGPGGKPIKSVPAAVKKDHAAALKALKADAESARKSLTAQKARIESFLLTDRAWTWAQLRERYFDHPLLGGVARRLIWRFALADGHADGIWEAESGGFVGSDGRTITGIEEGTPVRLWHPLRSSVEQIEQWRAFLESRDIRQPFKQAHREVYLLTDAEMNTRVYSNRFASHLLKQHQFNQLAVQRGWRNKLRLMVDDEYPPAQLLLPQYGLRAEFWVEGAGEEVNDTGTYLYLTTDQVRFYRIDAESNLAHAGGGGYSAGWNRHPAESLPLDTIPPLVFSEVMRDVDLFVGVASVGNDPAWSDGGRDGRQAAYWQDFAFGDLSASAQTRAAVLKRLLPRLKIASRCEVDGRFLRVRGDLRTYKIHLGSSNILMEPNDQYLCIVQAQGKGEANLFLPFEGDARLSVILSKAFLLADDTKITDPTIMRQIK